MGGGRKDSSVGRRWKDEGEGWWNWERNMGYPESASKCHYNFPLTARPAVDHRVGVRWKIERMDGWYKGGILRSCDTAHLRLQTR